VADYRKQFEIRWADLDPNWHLRHSAYADYCTQVRFSFLSEHGYPPDQFMQNGFAPVVFREETRYLKEVRAGDQITVDMAMQQLGSRGEWTITHQIFRSDGQLAAKHVVEGAFLDLNSRKLRPAPPELASLLQSLVSA
jgi:acyl-CoA thioester hydrolase